MLVRQKRTMTDLARLLAREEQSKTTSGSNAAYVNFWNLPANSTMLIRFVVDRDEDNPWPWVERRTMRFPFCGMINSDHDTTDQVWVPVPSLESWGEKCPVAQHIRKEKWWDGSEEVRNIARTYYRKPSWIMGGFIVSSPMTETNPPINPIRLFALNKQLHGVIEKAVAEAVREGDYDDQPWNLDDSGRCFRLTRELQGGQYGNYTSSKFAPRPSGLTAEQQAAIDQFGLPDLAKELGEKPSSEAVELMLPLMQDSLEGLPFDNKRYGAFFRAFRGGNSASGAAAPAPVSPRPSSGPSAEEVERDTETLLATLNVKKPKAA